MTWILIYTLILSGEKIKIASVQGSKAECEKSAQDIKRNYKMSVADCYGIREKEAPRNVGEER